MNILYKWSVNLVRFVVYNILSQVNLTKDEPKSIWQQIENPVANNIKEWKNLVYKKGHSESPENTNIGKRCSNVKHVKEIEKSTLDFFLMNLMLIETKMIVTLVFE